MITARIDNATGSVLEWGTPDLIAETGQSIVSITDASSFPEGTANRYVKVVGGLFVAMDATERAAVDLAIPQRRAQRIVHGDEVTVATNQLDPGGGWGDVIALTLAEPLLPGFYQVVCGFELALLSSSNVHTAQAQLEIDGMDVATWQNNRGAYTRFQFVDTFAFSLGDRPGLRLRIRRFGGGAGLSRARKASIVIYPAQPIRVELR